MFVRSYNPIWYLVDLVGNQLNDTFYLFVLTNEFPYIPSTIYQDPDGTIPWNFPIQFLPNGTLPDNMYFDPDLVYRLEIRQGNSQADALIYLIENYVPGSGGAFPSANSATVSNQITNPQFSLVDFTSPLTITTAGTYDVAPGWQLVTVGSGGTTIINQVITNADEATANNPIPPYYLAIQNSGTWTSVTLQQTFNNLGAIYANGNISMQISAFSPDGVSRSVSLKYTPQTPGTPITIVTAQTNTDIFEVIQGAIELPESTNSNPNNTSYVNMQIILPPVGNIDLSNVQVVSQDQPLQVSFEQETIERQQDHLFHYYKDSILLSPKESLLSGWNFPLNPWQLGNPAGFSVVPVASYITDQTILVQKNGAGTSVAVSQSNYNSALNVTAVAASNIFALIQYIDPLTIAPYWNSILSSLVTTIGAPSTVSFKMRLIYRNTLPSAIGSAEPIASWTGIDPVFSSGWTAIAPINDPTYTVTNGVLTSVPFNGFQLPAFAAVGIQTLGIVIYTTTNLGTSTPDTVVFDGISLVPNEFAIDSNVETYDQALKKCQYYYEMSYPNFLAIGTANASGLLIAPQSITYTGASRWSMAVSAFGFQFKNSKRANPTVKLYSPATGAVNNVNAVITYGATSDPAVDVALAGSWNAGTASKNSVYYTSGSTGAIATSSASYTANVLLNGSINFQYTADSRLGV